MSCTNVKHHTYSYALQIKFICCQKLVKIVIIPDVTKISSNKAVLIMMTLDHVL